MNAQPNVVVEMEPKKLEPQVQALVTQAKEIRIVNQTTYDKAVDFLKTIKGLRGEIEKTFRPIVEKAHATWKESLAQLNRHDTPLAIAEGELKNSILAFDRRKKEEEAARQRQIEEAARLKARQEAEKAEAEARERAKREADAAALQAKKDGESKRAIEEARKKTEQESLARQQQEINERRLAAETAPVREAAPAYERAAGVQTKENWQAEITSFGELVQFVAANTDYLELLEPDRLAESHPALTKLARALKSKLKLPGVRIYDKGTVSSSKF